MIMSTNRLLPNRVQQFRRQRGWSQHQLAEYPGVSRAAVSAIEVQRLVPSVATALALARAFACRVEDLFGASADTAGGETWAWRPTSDPCRFWRASVGGRTL